MKILRDGDDYYNTATMDLDIIIDGLTIKNGHLMSAGALIGVAAG